MSFKCFFNSHFVFVSQIHISFLQGSSFRFAVISKELLKLLQDKGFLCETKAFGTSSLFNNINSQDSTVNILIGSKKFTEGWSS